MSSPFLAEIRIFTGNFAPIGWATCDGQLLPISQNTALFSLLGTFYGGNGTTNFALPNLQGAAPLNVGQGNGLSLRNLGESGGKQTVTLVGTEIPAHSHAAQAYANAGGKGPAGNAWSDPYERGISAYAPSSASNVIMNPTGLSASGGSLPHNNMMPYLCLTFIIAMVGIFPARP